MQAPKTSASPQGRASSKPISITSRKLGGKHHDSSIAQSCPAPRAPIIGSLPAPSNMDIMPPLSLPPPSPEAFSMDPIYHRHASAKFASSCPATIAHFPRSLTSRAEPQRIQGSLASNNSLDSNGNSLSTSMTGLSILSSGNSLEKADGALLARKETTIAEGHEADDLAPTGRVTRTFSNSSADDDALFTLDGIDGVEKEDLDKNLETLDLEDDAGGMFDFES